MTRKSRIIVEEIDDTPEMVETTSIYRKIPIHGPASDWQGVKTTFEDEDPPKHFKMMCNTKVNGKRSGTNSKISKSIVEACAKDGIHLIHVFRKNGKVTNCFEESKAVQVGDIAHMYYGDLEKGNSKHFVGEVLSTYEKFSDTITLDDFPHVKEVWRKNSEEALFCRVAWEEVPMTEDDEAMIKYPGKNGFKVQGTILRIC
jgi:hypothetical protein